ncbi:type IIL restriction-modification enzyme MmeI [Ferruginibacter sp.]|uniref:type IIL restriction-modification enzyme MmeI n=1 Tax=Ferruginibacter sp. TaxID=1940288 RepID=UPI00374D455D
MGTRTQRGSRCKRISNRLPKHFGVSRKKIATFEHRVKKLSEADGYIDLLWKGQLLVEMKSRGKDLEKAYTQAKDYCAGLQD